VRTYLQHNRQNPSSPRTELEKEEPKRNDVGEGPAMTVLPLKAERDDTQQECTWPPGAATREELSLSLSPSPLACSMLHQLQSQRVFSAHFSDLPHAFSFLLHLFKSLRKSSVFSWRINLSSTWTMKMTVKRSSTTVR
jgi:hypothetical protein